MPDLFFVFEISSPDKVFGRKNTPKFVLMTQNLPLLSPVGTWLMLEDHRDLARLERAH